MRRLYPPLVIGSLASLVVGLGLVWSRADGRVPSRAAIEVEKPSNCKVLGVASCASMACHNGNGPRGSKGSEYTTWIAVDPHGRSYKSLFKEESKRMNDNLSKHDTSYQQYKHASDNPLCLKCHAMGDGVAKNLQADGVGCERCHGPAEKWKTTHYLDCFNRKTPGFVDTRDLPKRARTCMKCHVGDKDQEVNHDLIAAGHPRLRFEFGSYYANYPRHWRDNDKDTDPGFEARSWVVGQLMSAQTALELLASRTAGNDPITKEAKPWPEFAEYKCAACHHGLSKPSFRQERDLKLADKGVRVRGGDLPWGTWYYKLLPILAEQVGDVDAKKLQALRAALDQNLRKRLPPQAKVNEQAIEAAAIIGAWIEKVKNRPLTRDQTQDLFASLARQDALIRSGWDGGTQVFLGLAAAHHALCDLDRNFQARSTLRQPLLELRKNLRDSFDKDARRLYDSPLKYDPKPLLKDLANLQKLLK